MKSLFCVVLILSLSVVSQAWSDLYDNEFKRWALARRSFQCKSNGGNCYSTSDCCQNFICATLDDMDPTVPGWCVHEKELAPCVSSVDCASGTKCRTLDGHRYCVPAYGEEVVVNSPQFVTQKGTKGSNCQDERDCAPYDDDGVTKLCCQKIKRARQGVIKKCDPITPISMCITSRR